MAMCKADALDLLRTTVSVGVCRESALLEFAVALLFQYENFSSSLNTKCCISRYKMCLFAAQTQGQLSNKQERKRKKKTESGWLGSNPLENGECASFTPFRRKPDLRELYFLFSNISMESLQA